MTGRYGDDGACSPVALPFIFRANADGSTLAYYSTCSPPSDDVYLAQVDGGRLRVISAANLGGVAAQHPLFMWDPIGGSLGDLAARITERQPTNCGETKYNSLGLERKLVPPLENELTDTGSPYEDSFAYYLILAKMTATEAHNAGERAYAAEMEIAEGRRLLSDELLNIEADANDEIGRICGAGVDPTAGCRSARQVVTIGDTHVLPSSTCTDAQIPSYTGDPWAFTGEIIQFMDNRAACILAVTNGLAFAVPSEFVDGTLDASERGRYGGEYVGTLLDISSAMADITRLVIGMRGVVDANREHVRAVTLQLAALSFAELEALLKIQAAQAGYLAAVSCFTCAADGCKAYPGCTHYVTNVVGANEALATLEAVKGTLSQKAALQQFYADSISFVSGLEQQEKQLEATIAGIEKAVARLDQLEEEQNRIRAKADRHRATAALVANDPLRFKTYSREADLADRELRRAKLYSFIARRAIEFKLVKNLQKETGTEPFVQSPRMWVDSVFGATHAGDPDHTNTWAESTIGYVEKLRDYVNAYPFIYPFQDGDDWAVISLKDDYLRPEGGCIDTTVQEGRNLLPWSEEFGNWHADMAAVVRLDGESDPTDPLGTHRSSRVTGWTVSSSIQSAFVQVPAQVSGTDVTSVVFSIWMRADSPRNVSVCLELPDRVYLTCQQVAVGNSWDASTRLVMVADVPTEVRDLRARIEAPPGAPLYLFGAQVEIGSVVHEYQPTLATAPAVFDASKCNSPVYNAYGVPIGGNPLGSTRSQTLRDSFRVKCRTLAASCPADFDCTNYGGVEYHEFPFSFSIADIESGRIIKDGQIAVGNYNYRFVDLGLNFVGSNVKDCALDDINREACYANMFLPYSLTQDGHVQLRDYNQQILEFGMPSAYIQNGKGIAAERYLTIPLSGVDQAAITPFLKKEFRGRPLEGSFILRVHHVPSLAWWRLEDVQLLIHYRYWTAFGP